MCTSRVLCCKVPVQVMPKPSPRLNTIVRPTQSSPCKSRAAHPGMCGSPRKPTCHSASRELLACRSYGLETDLVPAAPLDPTPAPVRDEAESHGQVTPAAPALRGSAFDGNRATTPMVVALGFASALSDVIRQVNRRATSLATLRAAHGSAARGVQSNEPPRLRSISCSWVLCGLIADLLLL